MEISQLCIYPVKGMRAISLQQWTTDEFGLKWDRRFMVVSTENPREGGGLSFVTQRQKPRLTLIQPILNLETGELKLSAPEMKEITIGCIDAPERDVGNSLRVHIWDDVCTAVDQGDAVSSWLSEFIQCPVRLAFMSSSYIRELSAKYTSHLENKMKTGFADGFPFLITTEASLADLNARLGEGQVVEMRRFRPNIVVKNAEPWAEDTWKRIRVSSSAASSSSASSERPAVILHNVKPCSRCTVTTVDPDTGIKGKEPLETLKKFRHDASVKGPVFGSNIVHEKPGQCIAVGDSLEVLETRPPLEIILK